MLFCIKDKLKSAKRNPFTRSELCNIDSGVEDIFEGDFIWIKINPSVCASLTKQLTENHQAWKEKKGFYCVYLAREHLLFHQIS